MSDQKNILINDFNLFCEVIKSTAKIVESAKISIDQSGLTIFGARGRIARCEVTSNAVTSEVPVSFSILELALLVKVLQTVKDIHQDDFTGLKFFLDGPFVKFLSKKFKTKLNTTTEDTIGKWISQKITFLLTQMFEFVTTSDLIKRINSHSYIFKDQNMLRIYLETKDDMENNSLFATIGNKLVDLNNEMVIKAGIVTYGKIEEGRNIILDLERLNLFNSIQSDNIKVTLMDKNVLVSNTRLVGKNDSSYYLLTVYSSLLNS